MNVLGITWQSAKDFWEDFVFLLLMNVIWSLSVVLAVAPLLLLANTNPVLGLGLSLVLFVPVPIVSGGLCFVTNQISREKTVGWEAFFVGLRRYWAKSLVVALLNVIALILLVVNVQFYAAIVQGGWTLVVQIIFVVLGVYWLLVQIYWFPMILELESEKVFQALRNSLAMVLISPLFSLGVGVALLLLAVLCIALTIPALLIMAALLLLIMNHATRSRLAVVQEKREKWDREDEEDEHNG